MEFVYRSLKICLAALGIIILAGTLYAVFFRAAAPDDNNGRRSEAVQEGAASGQAQTFTGIGRMRISTAGSQPGMVILFAVFRFNPDDKAFTEELALRVRDFREIIADYIGAFPTAELQAMDEETIRAELLRRFNAILRLGQIEALFFSDFMIL